MSEEMITLPRSVVAALVDPNDAYYIDGDMDRCSHCEGKRLILPTLYMQTPHGRIGIETFGSHSDPRDGYVHAVDCPVRLAQEALAQDSR